ncbi:unnamed protein product, partial [Didymodactylos carnosus]
GNENTLNFLDEFLGKVSTTNEQKEEEKEEISQSTTSHYDENPGNENTLNFLDEFLGKVSMTNEQKEEEKEEISQSTTSHYDENPSNENILNFPSEVDKIDSCTIHKTLFKLNLKPVPLLSSKLIRIIHEKRQQALTSTASAAAAVPSIKAQKFIIQHYNGTEKTYYWLPDNLHEQLRKLVNSDKYAVIEKQNQIYVDINESINKNNNNKPVSLEYKIIEKSSLINIYFQFNETTTIKYLTTKNVEIDKVIDRLIDDTTDMRTTTILCFIDGLGKCINYCSVNDLYRTSDDEIRIKIIEEEHNNLCQINLHIEKKDFPALFHPTTKWQQIYSWLKTFEQITNMKVNKFYLWNNIQTCIIDDSQTISEVFKQQNYEKQQQEASIITIDGINADDTIKISFGYETNIYSIQTLKSSIIYDLLSKNEQIIKSLNLNISIDDCVLLIENSDKKQKILSQDNIKQPVGDKRFDDKIPTHFQISTLIKLTKLDDNQTVEVPISNRNITITELLTKFSMTTT